jgi:signal transduction histidine kinase
MLRDFLTANSEQLIAATRQKVAGRTSPMPTEVELEHGAPLFLRQLVDELSRVTTGDANLGQSAADHGGELLGMGFTVSQVVRGYGDVCQAVTELAEATHAPITVEEFRQFNHCLDEAIARAVTEYERRRDLTMAGESVRRQGALAHELRNRLAAATLAFNILRSGTVAIGGSTGGVLDRNLRAMRNLINDSLSAVRFEAGVREPRRVTVAALVDAVAHEVSMEAEVYGLRFAVASVAPNLEVDVDAQIVEAALANLLQNALKFSCAGGLVTLRVAATVERVSIEVEDECGGLPPGKIDDLFLPFEQRSANRTGLGLGLDASRRGIEAMGGTVFARDLPGQGCIFTIELPRAPTR